MISIIKYLLYIFLFLFVIYIILSINRNYLDKNLNKKENTSVSVNNQSQLKKKSKVNSSSNLKDSDYTLEEEIINDMYNNSNKQSDNQTSSTFKNVLSKFKGASTY